MTQRKPIDQPPERGSDWADEPKTRGDAPDDGMREIPSDPAGMLPAAATQKMVIATGVGLRGFADETPDDLLAGEEQRVGQREPHTDDADNEVKARGD